MSMILPVSAAAVAWVPTATGISGPSPFYFSDRGFTTGPTDPDLPNRHFAPRVSNPLTIERSLPLNPFATSRVLLQLGQIGLVNGDGGVDRFLRDYPIDGRSIEVKIGRPDFAFGQFETLFKGTARARRSAGRRDISFELRDASWRLDRPAQAARYTGAGGLEGGPEIAGLFKPACYGAAFNVTPVLANPASLVFQVGDRPLRRISPVYDRGLALTNAGDVGDILAAPTPTAGTYVTQLSGGYFRLGAIPDGLVTCDVEGDASYGNYVDKVADIAFRLMTDRAGLNDSDIDPASFDRLRSAQPAAVGIYLGPQGGTVAAALDVLFAGIGAWWGANRFDVIECGRIEEPAGRADVYLSTKQILDWQFIDLPPAIDPPWYRAEVGYARNWTLQADSFAGAVTPERRQFLANEWRLAPWHDPLVTTTHLRAQEAPALPSLFVDRADAETEVARLGALWGTRRSALRIWTKTQAYLRKLGDTVNIELPVAPLTGGRNAVVIGQGIDATRNAATLDLMW